VSGGQHDVAEQVRTVIQEITGVPIDWDDPSIGLHLLPEWGSLEQIRILAELHRRFSVGLTLEEASTLTSPSRLLRAVIRASGVAGHEEEAETATVATTPVPDRGLANTYLDVTRITDIDPVMATLRYRGHDVPTLARLENYDAVAHLLIEGELRDPDDRQRSLMLEGAHFACGLDGWDGPYHTFVAQFSSLPFGAFVEVGQRELKDQGWRLLGAAVQLFNGGRRVVDVGRCGIAASITARLADPVGDEVAGVNQLMILQADHGSSAAALAVRTGVSADAGLHPSVLAGLACFGGRRHGGAMSDVVRIIESVPEPTDLRALARTFVEEGRAVPGFGHRVYRTRDPRVAPIRDLLYAAEAKRGDHWWSTRLEQLRQELTPLEDVGAVANVDLYSGALLRHYGFPTGALTKLFAVARMAGWTAHAAEQAETRTLIRPKLQYVGLREEEEGP
jgi:citrate synthase